ncbi:MAG: efflux RND transporter permease subunit, partial [Anaerolineales bacterium]|nr:efflux RND transporter permease subunit [Anaerolineales bacterium]
ANVVAVCESIQAELEAIQEIPSLQENLTIQIFDDMSEQILNTLDDLKTAGIYGGILAMIILFLFLMKVRSTLIIGLAIPVSIVFTCAFLFLMRVIFDSDITLNTISLMGMMVAVGMLVDNSVVVLENIFRYRQDKGLPAIEAAIRGSREVGVAVLASTSTTVVVFASFIFMPNGISGRFMRDFGITVAVALVASLIVAITIVPMIASKVFAGEEKKKQRIILVMEGFYRKIMRVFLKWRFVSLIVMAGLGYLSFYLFNHIEREFYPNVAEREVSFRILIERSFSLEDMLEVYSKLENLLLDNAEELEITSVSSRFSNNSTRRGQYWGNLNIILTEEGEMTPTLELRDKIEEMFPVLPGVEYRLGRMRHMGGGSEMGISLEVTGDDPAVLEIWANLIKRKLGEIPGLTNVQTSLETGDDEIHFSADREKLEKFGLYSRTVAQTVSSALSSRSTTKIKGDNGEIDVIVYLRGENAISLGELMNINLQNREGEMIPIHSVVDFEYAKGPVALERENRKMTVDVTADTEKGGSYFASMAVKQVLDELNMPAGYTWKMGRSFRDARQGEDESMFSIYLALIFMYIIMASLFENFIHPLTILCTVPFSLIGVAWIFYVTNTSLSQMAYLGILVLFGIVVNNGIILLDHINFLRRSGKTRNEAIIQGGSDRLRPILMTAATSIFGMLPLTLPYIFPTIFGGGSGSGYWEPVSLAVLGGLTTSTFLTLLILPPVYSYMDDLSRGVMWVAIRIANPGMLIPARWRMSER